MHIFLKQLLLQYKINIIIIIIIQKYIKKIYLKDKN